MSFKRKTVTINSSSSRAPGIGQPSTLRGPPLAGRGAPPPISAHRSGPLQKPSSKPPVKDRLQHIAIRPSIHSAVSTISTGSNGLDDILQHGGLPLGSVLLVEESGNTDFASILLRSFAALGIHHNRTGLSEQSSNPFDSKVIAVGVEDFWGAELPGNYVGSSKDQKKLKIKEDEKKVTVGNLANETSERNKSLKIAWRYANQGNTTKDQTANGKHHYTTLFDYKSRIRPQPNPNELEAIGLQQIFSSKGNGSFFQAILKRLALSIEQTLKKCPDSVIRIVVPSLLHPAVYPPDCSVPKEFISFIHGLVYLAKKHSDHVAILMSISLELFPRELSAVRWAEILVDGVLQIDPFPEKMENLSTEAPNDDDGSTKNKPYQGLVHIYKLPVFSQRGHMEVRRGEFAFRVGRKSFEIDEWGIPVEEPTQNEVPAPSNSAEEIDINQKHAEEGHSSCSSSSCSSGTASKTTKPAVDLRKLDF
ncbi:similar to Saccharomyces cerevisiae YPL101W ELP4 Subunit of hexameric RecA-like ATPase Elp456 Elongator subcomplex [Geotrichum candidum]|uniref:Elongator complex protein 4 n=1 Tax=Geotrichum candidum TaxID=1173061 RepID=A0A0J9X7C0_GEOCN|nr:similar to Saccharomyces cerevisiae YPL101W ELP4 Subunit of hexameric RecA-like ATPase Elp456 Elongator subcomplex [Geotrichum candidum]